MARLPTVGSDDGNWGTLLNQFLQVEHNSDGTHPASIVVTKSATAPSSPSTNNLWYDTANEVLKRWNGTAWVSMTVPTGPTGVQGPPGLVWKGTYSNATTYGTNDAVYYNGSSFIATAGTTGVNPGTAASPNSPWQALASIGTQGNPGSGMSNGDPDPTWNSLLGWNFDPMFIAAAQSPTSGVLYLFKVYLAAGTITNLHVDINAAIVTPTASANYVGLYNSSGTLVASTADQGSNWGSTGVKTIPLTTPYSASAGFYYIGILANASTTPQFNRASSAGHFNNNTSSSTFRSAGYGSSQTSLPGSVTLSSAVASNTSFWVGVS